jgi:3-hydroxybutyryl-CoA dehydrogenase
VSGSGYETPAVAGTGAIGCALAAAASALGEVRLLARSDASAWRAEEAVEGLAGKVEGGDAGRVRVTTEPRDLAACDLVVEAIREDLDEKVALLATLGESSPDADLASTTSSLAIADLASRSGHADRVLGLHVFNPVHRMELVELCLPDELRPGAAERVEAWCRALGKTPIRVPDEAGFVVNRLLFPYLFDAVRMMERTGMSAEDVDACMTLGTGHPMGPLRLLDFVGLDVAEAIGDALYADSGEGSHRPPGRLVEMVGEGRLGRKSDAGFYEY